MTEDEQFAHNIGYGLWQAMRKKVPIADCQVIAESVVAYLRLCGWTWRRGKPGERQ